MTHIKIMVGGPETALPQDVYTVKQDDAIWIGVDHGAIRLLKRGITPAIAIGDFDSITAAEMEYLTAKVSDVRSFPSEKDDTDTELAIQLALEECLPNKISVYGATAGRLDHLMSNLFFIFQPRFQQQASKIYLYDKLNSVSFYLPGEYTVTKEEDKKYIAFVCMTPVKKLSLRDVKYTLKEKNYDYPISLASNEFRGQVASFSFTQGLVAVIQSKD
ncbi:thiamine diphosphokinase [Desemzia sp. RIT804]|uniref:thiamine diphosphokinase n=1 Tax=Desemzia sp. RIT 804 TaxID=2810209 RepID=UPI00194FEAB6|nr:thiamine diphosphokinase [Desemzia sp. RIT 804]MBM6613665.1 thiamine diphosphokinase [Desemzia sp. RIT 804]